MGSKVKKRKWYAMFSQTGRELEAIVKKLGLTPDLVITTNTKYEGPLNALKVLPATAELTLVATAEPGSLITLHGYRHLIRKKALDIFAKRDIQVVNIHPAPVFMENYADLRGLDPHERYYTGFQTGIYPMLGVTLHEVDAGIDTGKVVYGLCKGASKDLSYEQFCDKLHDMGTIAWMDTLPKLLGMEV